MEILVKISEILLAYLRKIEYKAVAFKLVLERLRYLNVGLSFVDIALDLECFRYV